MLADKRSVIFERPKSLIISYHYGRGVEKNEIKAFEYYYKAAENGHGYSNEKLADCYYKRIEISLEKNISKSIEYYQKADDLGVSHATYKLADFYFNEYLNI